MKPPAAVAVSGASGSLGRPLAALLARRGFEVRALVRDPAAFATPAPGIRAFRCDLPDAIDETALAGAGALVHCAYATRETDAARARRVNEEGTRRLLEASHRAGVQRFVFISSIVAHPDAPNYYGRSKHALEGLLDPSRDLVVRPGTMLAREGHSIFQQMRDAARRTHVLPVFGGGRQPLQTVHVDDVCEALVRALERDLTGALNIAEPEPVPFGRFLRMMTERLGIRCVFVPLPFAPVLAMVRAIEALRLPFPLRSESLLGVKALRRVPVMEDLRRLDLRVRAAAESLADLAGPPPPPAPPR
jgi:nucleoside-diphosphate-sugar epimerase